MGWHECSQCGSKKWTLFVHPRGCNICKPTLEEEVKQETREFFERHKDSDLVGGVAVI